MSEPQIAPIEKTITVPCAPDTAFAIFTRDITKWWPLGVNSVSAMDGKPAQAVKLELKEGGRLSEIGHDGTVHNWGSVKVFQPGEHLQLAWHIGTRRRRTPPGRRPLHPNSHRGQQVKLTHTLGAHGRGRGTDARESYNKGWVGVFEEAYKTAAQAKAA
jgi:hypothetical protein